MKWCRIRDGGGVLEGRNLPQQTMYHWKGNLWKSPVLISRLYEQFSRNAPLRLQEMFQTLN